MTGTEGRLAGRSVDPAQGPVPSRLHGAGLAALALTLNAFIWGVSWFPFRMLEARGLHPLWITAFIYGLAVLAISAARPKAWRELAHHRSLWLIALAAGMTNATFNWGVTFGDVVRVVLMFYLMPVWAVLLARLVLGEPLRPAALLRVALALTGAAIVIWPAGGARFEPGLPELLGIAGGVSFACNNVMLRREAQRSDSARALAMFLGGALVAGLVAAAVAAAGGLPWPAMLPLKWGFFALGLAFAFLVSNLSLQYGATRLPANVTAVIMLMEVLFAAGSAALLGAAHFTPALWLGGGLIVAAALLAALSRARAGAQDSASG